MNIIKRIKTKYQSGFMLLEVMLALSILSISLIAIMSAFSTIVRSNSVVSNYTKAMFLLDNKLHWISVQAPKKVLTDGTFDDPFGDFRWHVDQKATAYTDVKKVSLSILWIERGTTKKVSATTCLNEGNDETN